MWGNSMSVALVHFLFGATIALWFMTFEPDSYDNDGLWWAYVGGIYAMIPDLNKFIPRLDSVHSDPFLSNVFALHGLFDVADPNDSIYVAAIMVAVFGISVLLTRYHGLR
jgi:hypothetical protein